MAMTGGSSTGIKSEINVTPLVDVVLVLLIIFMVVTPMLQRGKDVHLPKARAADTQGKEADPLVLSLTQDKAVWIEQRSVDDGALSDELRREIAARPGRKLLVKGDDRLSYGDVRRVMEIARLAGAKGVSLGIEELDGKGKER
jgi:biopolymer transport protein TolR